MIHYISQFTPPWHTERYVADALDRPHCPNTRYEFHDSTDRPGRSGRPPIKPADVVLTSVPSRFPVNELEHYKAQGALLVCWYFDWIWNLGNRAAAYLPRLLLMDAVFSTDGFCGREYVRRGVNCRHYLPQGAPPLANPPPPPPGTPRHELAFLGHLHTPDRRELERRCRARWNFYNPGLGPRVWGRTLSDVCQTTAIMLGTNYRNDVAGYWSNRVYVVMGAGGFYLGQHVRGLNRSFQDGVHCGYFDGLPDMERKIAWWLAHPAEREACRQRGFALVQREHTYTNRVELLLYALRSRGFLL